MAEFRPAQEQAQHPGEEHLMDPIPKHHGSNYLAAGKLKVCNLSFTTAVVYQSLLSSARLSSNLKIFGRSANVDRLD